MCHVDPFPGDPPLPLSKAKNKAWDPSEGSRMRKTPRLGSTRCKTPRGSRVVRPYFGAALGIRPLVWAAVCVRPYGAAPGIRPLGAAVCIRPYGAAPGVRPLGAAVL